MVVHMVLLWNFFAPFRIMFHSLHIKRRDNWYKKYEKDNNTQLQFAFAYLGVSLLLVSYDLIVLYYQFVIICYLFKIFTRRVLILGSTQDGWSQHLVSEWGILILLSPSTLSSSTTLLLSLLKIFYVITDSKILVLLKSLVW